MKKATKHSGSPKVVSATDAIASSDKEQGFDSLEFDVDEPDDTKQRMPVSYGGSFKDIAQLKPVIDALEQMKEAETRHLIAIALAVLFAVWTIIGLLFFIHTGNSWILVSDAGPGALFGIVVNYYFRQKKRKKPGN